MLHCFICVGMLTVVLYIVFKWKTVSLMIFAPLTGIFLTCFLILKVVSIKTRISKKDYLAKLNEIIAFYNSETLKERNLFLTTGSSGAYVAL